MIIKWDTTKTIIAYNFINMHIMIEVQPYWKNEKITKPKCNICTEECLTILKIIRDKRVTPMNNNSEIYEAFRIKRNFH